jgi:glycosyltransferase involved in cell wall biosynthesis
MSKASAFAVSPSLSNVTTLVSAKLAGGRGRTAVSLSRTPTVSVVVPCYNYGRFLRQCVQSVISDQPGVDVEVIIIDDKSTDNSLEIAQELRHRDGRIRVIAHKENRGHIETYNDGLAVVTGEYVLLLSADDLITAGALGRAAELLEAEPSVGLVYGNVVHFCDNLPAAGTRGSTWIVWSGSDWLRHRCNSGYNVVNTPTAVMRTSVLKKIGGYRSDLPHAGDFEMWMRTSAVADIGYLVDVDQAYYRHHDRNMNRAMFGSGSAKGQLIDLRQRWKSFESVFAGAGRSLAEATELREIARATITRHALEHAHYAYARGFRDFPVAEFEAFANEVNPMVGGTRMGWGLAMRKRMGMISLPLHPLWALSALHWRFKEVVRRWRRQKVGI